MARLAVIKPLKLWYNSMTMISIMYKLTILSAFVFCGCYSIETAGNAALRNSSAAEGCESPVEHVLISNNGWYFLNSIPLACGNTSNNRSLPWIFFSDHVNPTIVHDRMMEYAKSMNANIKDVVGTCDEKVFMEVPQIPIPIPFLLCYREVQISAVLVKRSSSAGEKASGKEVTK